MTKEFESYLNTILDGAAIQIGELCLCPIHKEPTTGWPLESVVYQVTFYDRYQDFEVSSFHTDAIDAVRRFLELRDVVSQKQSDGRRVKTPRLKYDKIYSYEPSAYGDRGKQRLKTRKNNAR